MDFLVKISENSFQKKHIVYTVKVNFASESKYYLKPHSDPPLPLPTLYRPTTSLPTIHFQVFHEAPT